jgi:ABC-type nitrate/sulfonate/bicarbonate transport system permease component
VDLLGLAGLVLVVAVWYGLSHVVSRTSLPAPQAVAERTRHDFIHDPLLSTYGLADKGLLSALIYTTQNVFIAVSLGAVFGVTIGLVSARVATIRAVVNPIVATLGAVPVLVAAPFFLIWFGVDRRAAILLVALYSMVVLIIYSQRAAENIHPAYENAARTFGASRPRILKDVVFPATTPEVLGGLRIALAGAWGLEAVAEVLGLPRGVGQVISVLGTSFDAEGILAVILPLGILAVTCDALMAYGINRALPWRTR